ncbi:MAG: HesA/MoeB/ThiF family protein [Candidatus Bathyarchaeota archaeon]|nr:MAG: HesA/MoeB/ThiF family protein [Candidatus Bathyarchaeota archaeon]
MTSPKIFDSEEFYSRQVVLPELRPEGQERLKRSKAVIVGLGGLGSVSALYLALAGVGHLRLVDQDTVELNNLHRQVLYELGSLRYPKVEAAARRIEQVNPEVRVEPLPEHVREDNIRDIVEGMNCVVDGLDNMQTRYLLNRACAAQKIPYVFGAAIGIEGNLSVFAPPETPCLECVLPNLDDRHLPTCDTRGVLGATTGIIGSMQALETIKLLAGMGDSLKGKLMVCDFRDMFFTTIEIFKRSDCPVCQGKSATRIEQGKRLTWLCGQNTVNVNPPRPVKVNLGEIHENLRRDFRILIKSSFVVVFEYDDVEASLFSNGRMLVKNVKDEEAALKVYNKVIEKLGLDLA